MSRPIPKDWMNERDRFSDAYQKGVAGFIDFAKQNNKEGLETCFCPCKKCLNKSRVPFIRLKNHLVTEGIDPKYQKWVFHGEKSYTPPTLGEDREEIRQRLGNFVDDCYGIDGRAVADADGSVDEQEGDFEEEYLPEPDLPKRYSKYKRLAEEKLYPECEGDETTLSAIVELHNVKKLFGWSGASVTYLLRILKRWLPKGNTLPSKYPEMKAMIKDLGMDVKRIDVCENNCILYWKENKDATECPQCKAPRYKVKLGKKGKVVSKEANKVLRHFPLASRLKRLYTIPWIANEMTWHDRATASKTLMRHPIDSVQWQSTKDKWPEFAIKKRNAWCAIATDGFNPRGIQSTSYSCWPVFTITYNLPPSLCMKEEFQMMSLLIPGPKAPGQDIDVFLEPLFDEFDQLWESGELAYDMHDMQPFTLRALLLWGIHDFPAYGNLSGSITHGYKACPCCGDETPSVRTPVTKKIVYLDFRRFLTMDHPFRLGGRFGFKTAENRIPPQPLSGSRLLEALSHVHYIPGKISKGTKRPCANANEIEEADGSESEVGTDAWYRKSLLYKLKYWPGHKIRHVLDVMHVEKNVSEHILHMLLDKDNKTKDTVNAREDMRLMGIHQGQWMTTHKVTGELTKPIAPYDMTSEDRRIFFQTLRDLKLPSGFSSNLSNIVNPNLSGLLVMKSHDHHVILEYLLPVLLQHAFPKHRNLRRALHQISLFFRILCSKVLFRQEIKDAKNMVIAALSVLESLFPPSFFDISIHLVAHLADEALMCGPVHPRWMYPFERAMKECKDIPSNKRYVEGSIAESYLVSESVRYAMEYMPNKHGGDSYSRREAFLDEDGIYGPNGGPILAGNPVILKPEQFVQIRRWLLFRVDDVPLLDEYYSQYRNDVEPITRGRGKHTVTEVEIQTKFIEWLYEKLLEEGSTSGILWRLVKGPLFDAKTYRKYRINGFVFSPKYHDDTVSTQDSGVCMKAITTFRSSRRDKNLIDAEIMWYGIIKEILEVDYIEFKEVIFYCDWVKVEDKANGCKICQDSNLMTVNLNNLKKSDHVLSEPAILASEASQVFYSRDLKNPNWWVVIHSPSRLKSQVDQLDVPLDVRSILADEPHLKCLMEGVH